LLVQTHTQGIFILNNFQGGLPSRYQKHADRVRVTIHDLINEIGCVLTTQHYCNAMDLTTDMARVKLPFETKVPNLRFDVPVNNDDRLIDDGCWYCNLPEVISPGHDADDICLMIA